MEHLLDENTIPPIKPRSGWVAFSLSLLFPGLSQVYNGQPKKAVLLYGILLLFPFIFGLTRCTTTFYGLLSLFTIELITRVYITVDAIRHANKQKEYILKSYNTWYYYLLIVIGMVTISLLYNITDILGTQTFKIPTISGHPTIQEGDWVVADLRAYQNTSPDYGDIVVFTKPDGQIYTFRIVGLPNDNIEVKDNSVIINGNLAKTTFIRKTLSEGLPALEFEEELPNGHKHSIYKFETSLVGKKSTITNVLVPPNSYYLLGDNRDNAADSRYGGFVNENDINGQIVYSYWGESIDRINIDFRDK